MSYDSPVSVSTPRIDRNRPYFFDEAPQSSWTAARCDTLIATLTGRLERLKNDGVEYLAYTADSEATDKPSPESPNIFKLKRRNRTTYARRARRSRDESGSQASVERNFGPGLLASPKRTHGETWGATPFLVRNKETTNNDRIPTTASPTEKLAEEKSPRLLDKLRPRAFSGGPSQYQLRQQLKHVKASMPANQYAMSMHLCESYQELLRATETPSSRASEPSKSLLSMCLRAMPGRLQLEQELEDFEAKAASLKLITAARSVSSEIYSEIRDLDLGGHGGEHIRTTLRAHGTAIIRDAVDSGILCQEFGTLSIMHCIQMRCMVEAEVLVMAVLSKTQWCLPTSFNSRLPPPFSALEVLRRYPGCTSAYFRVLTNMILMGRLPIHWLATKDFRNLWPRIYAALAGNPIHRQEAKRFTTVVLPLLFAASIRSSQDVSAITTFTSLLSTLCTIVFVERLRGSVGEQSYSGINNVLQSFIIDVSRLGKSQHLYIQVLVSLLTHPVASKGVDFSEMFAESRSCERTKSDPIWNITSSLTCSVLSRCERAEPGMGLRQLLWLSEIVEQSTPLPMLAGQALQSAMAEGMSAFAKTLADLPTAADAEAAAQKLCTYLGLESKPIDNHNSRFESGVSHTPPKLSVGGPAGCRWEEGIGEWVVITPESDMAHQASMHVSLAQVADSPLAPYRARVQSRISYSSKRKQPAMRDNSCSLLDLLPSSPKDTGGSDTEPESSFSSGTIKYSYTPPSPREGHGFRGRAKRFRKSQHSYSTTLTQQEEKEMMLDAHELHHADLADPFADIGTRDIIRLRTPFPPSSKCFAKSAVAEDSHYGMDSSGDELGY